VRTKTKFGRDPEEVEPGDEAGELDGALAEDDDEDDEDDEVQPTAASRAPASRTTDNRRTRILRTDMNRMSLGCREPVRS
jgi:hypothetical protein